MIKEGIEERSDGALSDDRLRHAKLPVKDIAEVPYACRHVVKASLPCVTIKGEASRSRIGVARKNVVPACETKDGLIRQPRKKRERAKEPTLRHARTGSVMVQDSLSAPTKPVAKLRSRDIEVFCDIRLSHTVLEKKLSRVELEGVAWLHPARTRNLIAGKQPFVSMS